MAISVIIPTYNGAPYIRDALSSVFAQTRLPVELIVADDASTDGTLDVVAEIARKSPIPVRIIQLPRNTGSPAEPIDRAINAAIGDYIAVLDQDDEWLPRKLEQQAALLDGHEDLAFSFGYCGRLDAPNQILYASEAVQRTLNESTRNGVGTLSGNQVLALLVRFGNFIVGYPGFMFRRRLLAPMGGIDKTIRIASDYDLLLRLCRLGRVGFVNDIHYLHRQHSDNLCNNAALVRYENVLLRTRHRRAAGLNAAETGELVRDSLDAAYEARQAGQYALAWKCLRQSATIKPVSLPLLSWCAKTAMHQARSCFATQC